MAGFAAIGKALEILNRRGVITTDPDKREKCCGAPRDPDGFCRHRPGHPIYVDLFGANDDLT